MADRYTYLPGIGLGIAAVWTLSEALRPRPGLRPLLAAAAALAVVALAGASFTQAGVWRDSETLFTRALAVTQGNWLAHDQLGISCAAAGRTEEARGHYEEAIRLNPFWQSPRNNLGNLLLRAGRPAEAVEQHRLALLLRPGDPVLLYNLGIGLAALGRLEEARAAYLDAAAKDPGNANIRLNLALVLKRLGDVDGARASFAQALALDPANDAARRGLERLRR
jgi:Flp pilus assembly protein TadD